MPVQNFNPFHKNGYQGRQRTRGGRRRGQGGRGYNRAQEEFPRHEAWHDDNLFEDYGENPNVGQANFGGYYGGQQGDKALDKIKWKVLNFKGKVIQICSLIGTNQLELYPYTIYEDMCHLATKIDNKRKRSGCSKATLPSSRNMVPKPQTSTYKSWPKKNETPKVVFKDSSKPKVEEKARLVTNPTRCFKCNGVEHIAINCPTKSTLVFCEFLNG
ncbi:hypothetical protein M9H77_03221 [Catharanthus roseus]|uniref:Uncharacterized protein n=1 Tax=Catharanthus roseus TaxID=4058 RepID=A0ACC0CB26_CATRO|nr:hypothetical protein M9H77_03221 [Catharanthus roseus]